MDDEVLKYKERLVARSSEIPIWEKKCLTINEAAEYSGIGRTMLRKLTTAKKCPFIVSSSNQVLIVREKFESYINKQTHIRKGD